MKSINKKRKKSGRMHGSHTHGRGFKKKGRGSGHRGGFGMAGTGKRADQKKTLILNLPYEYFGKKGLNPKKKRYEIVNVGEIEKLAGDKKEINLKKFKILGNGEINQAITIYAYSVSKSAIKKIEKAGGKVIVANSEKNNQIEKKQIKIKKKDEVK